MRRNAQAAIEYMFMAVLGLIVIFVVLKTFIDPRTGTIRKTGAEMNNTTNRTVSTLGSMISTP